MKKRPNRYYLTYLWTWPWDLVVWLGVLVTWLFVGTKIQWQDGLWCELRRNSFFSRVWNYAGVTLGHGGIYNAERSGGPGVDTSTEKHELVHVEQYEVAMLISFISGIAVSVVGLSLPALITGASIWVLGWYIVYYAASFQAWLRGEPHYRGNIFEESAYSQVD